MESLTNKLEIFTDFKVKYNIVWDTWKYKYSIIKTNYVITVVSYIEDYVHMGQITLEKLVVILDYNGMSMKMLQIKI